MLAETLEFVRSSPSKRTLYVRVVVAALAAILALKIYWFVRWGFWHDQQVPDFAAFHLVAQRIWLGDLDLTYQFAVFMKMQASLSGGASGFMPWTYPPQFDLLLAPLAFLPTWAAYALFTGTTLAAYLITLRKLAGEYFAQVLVILFPAIAITIGCGQNGLLTGALIGLPASMPRGGRSSRASRSAPWSSSRISPSPSASICWRHGNGRRSPSQRRSCS